MGMWYRLFRVCLQFVVGEILEQMQIVNWNQNYQAGPLECCKADIGGYGVAESLQVHLLTGGIAWRWTWGGMQWKKQLGSKFSNSSMKAIQGFWTDPLLFQDLKWSSSWNTWILLKNLKDTEAKDWCKRYIYYKYT